MAAPAVVRFSSPLICGVCSRHSQFLIRLRPLHCTNAVFGLSKAKSALKIERKTAKMMEKRVGGKMSKKKLYFNPGMFTPQAHSEVYQEKQSLRLGLAKRLQKFGSIIHENVSSLVDSGALGDELVNYGMEISKVVIPPDFNSVNIYWFGSGIVERDEKIETLLQDNAYKLRHELIQLHVLSNIPKINFVKDLTLARYTQVERLLETADMGDYDDVECHGDNHILNNDNGDDSLRDLAKLDLRSDIYDVDHEALTRQVNIRKRKHTDRFAEFNDELSRTEKPECPKLSDKRRHLNSRSMLRGDASEFGSSDDGYSLVEHENLSEDEYEEEEWLNGEEEFDPRNR